MDDQRMMAQSDVIHLFIRNGQWVARFSGPHSYPMISDFGTAEIRTSYNWQADPGDVAAHFAEQFPSAVIITGGVTRAATA